MGELFITTFPLPQRRLTLGLLAFAVLWATLLWT